MYNKLFAKIVTSSIWLQPDATRLVWLTLIALMDEEGVVQMACLENLAHVARVTVPQAKAAVNHLEGPDPNSSDPENEGRRIERFPGGWIVLNADKYRRLATREMAKVATRERVRRFRERKRSHNGTVTDRNVSVTTSEADTDTETAPPPPPPVARAITETTVKTQDNTAAAAAAQEIHRTNTDESNGKPLSKKARGMETVAIKLAVSSGNVLKLIEAFRGNLSNGRDAEWLRDTDGMAIGSILLIMAWKRWQKDPVREPSGFRTAHDTWKKFQPETRRHFAATLLPEYGLSLPAELDREPSSAPALR